MAGFNHRNIKKRVLFDRAEIVTVNSKKKNTGMQKRFYKLCTMMSNSRETKIQE